MNRADHASLHAGAELIRSLLFRVAEVSNTTCDRFDEPGCDDTVDGRDYKVIASDVEGVLHEIATSPAAVKEGACRALADLFAEVADTGKDLQNWTPLARTAVAFMDTGATRS